jgi:hypothetical protein
MSAVPKLLQTAMIECVNRPFNPGNPPDGSITKHRETVRVLWWEGVSKALILHQIDCSTPQSQPTDATLYRLGLGGLHHVYGLEQKAAERHDVIFADDRDRLPGLSAVVAW